MEEQNKKNPWLGLESYKEGEILYGRDDDIRDLTQSVLSDIDTLLYGRSGIGKSSILNAGIIPAARRNGYLPVLVRFSHKEDHSYLYQIRESIANAMIPIPLDESGNQIELSEEGKLKRKNELAKRIKEAVKSKNKEKESLYEFFHCHTFHNAKEERIKLLIIFDQFEEIFTLQTDENIKKQFFAELADLLNDIMPTVLQQNLALPVENERSTIVENDDDFDAVFDDIDLAVKSEIPNFVSDNEIHWVFTIREDFLSEFEYYTASIPSLKQNRYGLRAINEEQAAQIIMRPMPGLIDKSVAKLIIEKVTGKSDFKLDGIPEIEVDSAVLSLYLNRLYNAKTTETITSELIEEKGSEIIKDFYADAISGIKKTTIEYLEDMLLNGQGRRDNITIYDAEHDGRVTDEELDILCNKKKILRQFNYAGDLRIEYVHDILCPVVRNHKDGRLLIKQQEEEKLKLEKEKKEQERRIGELEKSKKRQKYIYRGLVALLLAFLIYGIYLILSMPLGLFEDDSLVYHICLKAEVIEDGDDEKKHFGPDDYWDVSLLFWTKGKSDTLRLAHPIDPAHCNFHKGGGADSLVLSFTKSEIDSLKEIMVEIRPKTTLCKKDTIPINLLNLNNNPIPVRISKNYEETDLYKGSVFTILNNSKTIIPINEALVVVAGRTTYTNESGQYVINIPRGNAVFNRIYIIKQGYRFEETHLIDNNEVLLTRDTTINFQQRRSDILALWDIASFDNRTNVDTKPKDIEILNKFQIDIKNKRNLKRGESKADTLRYVCYRIANSMDDTNNVADAKIGDVRNILGTYKDKKGIYIFDGYMTLENPDSNQWLLEFTQYDSVFNTLKKKATLMHANDNQRTKLLFNRK